jgi:hypothetical protein
MLQLRNRPRKRPKPVYGPPVPPINVLQPISVPKTLNATSKVYNTYKTLTFLQYISQPWSTTAVTGNPSFSGTDLGMYTFKLADGSSFYDFYLPSGYNIICKVYSSNNLELPRTTCPNYNTIHGSKSSKISDLFELGKYVWKTGKSIQIPVGYWGPHDTTCKLTVEIDAVKTLETEDAILTSSQFAAMTNNAAHF